MGFHIRTEKRNYTSIAGPAHFAEVRRNWGDDQTPITDAFMWVEGAGWTRVDWSAENAPALPAVPSPEMISALLDGWIAGVAAAEALRQDSRYIAYGVQVQQNLELRARYDAAVRASIHAQFPHDPYFA